MAKTKVSPRPKPAKTEPTPALPPLNTAKDIERAVVSLLNEKLKTSQHDAIEQLWELAHSLAGLTYQINTNILKDDPCWDAKVGSVQWHLRSAHRELKHAAGSLADAYRKAKSEHEEATKREQEQRKQAARKKARKANRKGGAK